MVFSARSRRSAGPGCYHQPVSRRNVLYVSPVMPAVAGNGLAMRAGMVLEALAVDHDVHLLVIPVHKPFGSPEKASEIVSRWLAGIAVLRLRDHEHPLFRLIARAKDPRERLAGHRAYPRPALCRVATPGAIGQVARAFPGVTFSAVHVFRLYLAPFVERYLRARRGRARSARSTWTTTNRGGPDASPPCTRQG